MIPAVDAAAKIPAIIAGGERPDLLYVGMGQFGDLPAFLKAEYTDLSPYISGDAVRDYPNLAAYPAYSWRVTQFDNAIYALPFVRPFFNWVWFVNQTRLDVISGSAPKNAEDFKRLLTDLTRPQSTQYGIGAGTGFGLQNTGKGDVPMLAMFGAPNNWAVD